MLLFLLILSTATALYCIAIFAFTWGLFRLKRQHVSSPDNWPSISIIVPARNEADVLQRTLKSLLEQSYAGPWEIIVVDDRSTDSTPALLATLSSRHTRIKPLTVTEKNPQSPKKNALAKGIQSSTADIIVTTDADCTYHPEWLSTIVSHFSDKVGVVAGLTLFDFPPGTPIPAWQKIQWLDFFVQNFLAASSVGLGLPSSCNGSNLAYRRNIYNQIEGFGQSANIVSGDDVLFAQRVAMLTSAKMAFATDPRTIVRSLPVQSFRELVHQRLRWASKGLTYRRSMLLFLFAMYAFDIALIAAIIAAAFSPTHVVVAATIWTAKLCADYILIRYACHNFGQSQLLRYFVPFSFAHVVATPLIGIGGLLVPYRWKGDWYRTSRLPHTFSRRMAVIKRRFGIHSSPISNQR